MFNSMLFIQYIYRNEITFSIFIRNLKLLFFSFLDLTDYIELLFSLSDSLSDIILQDFLYINVTHEYIMLYIYVDY